MFITINSRQVMICCLLFEGPSSGKLAGHAAIHVKLACTVWAVGQSVNASMPTTLILQDL